MEGEQGGGTVKGERGRGTVECERGRVDGKEWTVKGGQ